MRIQHNVTALNSYRNLRTNNTALAKNLEKLSSGYRINRAGDDAAGLAVSEKMRAQITGLETAKQNAQDGISLVQTAEGALTEVHGMLNRMVELATRSSNGTYDDKVDRANIQKEVTALKGEIDRISKASNYNGINLLDGSLSDQAKVQGEVQVNMGTAVKGEDIKAIKGSYKTTALTSLATTKAGDLADGDKYTFQFTYKDSANGKEIAKSYTFTHMHDAKGAATAGFLIAEDGTKYACTDVDKKGGCPTANELSVAILGEVKKDKDVTDKFDVSVDTAAIKFDAKEAGDKGAVLTSVGQSVEKNGNIVADKADAGDGDAPLGVAGVTNAQNSGVSFDLKDAKIFGNMAKTDDANIVVNPEDVNKAAFEVNGKKFAFISDDLTKEQYKALNDNNIHYVAINAAPDGKKTATITNADVTEMVNLINNQTGLDAKQGANDAGVWTAGVGDDATKQTNTKVWFKNSSDLQDKSLTLQIGDTADSFNKMKVSIAATDSKSLGIADIDVSTQDGAAKAIGSIKNAINTVSGVRGDMGALQNRLEHTINNLGVMHENITDAESRIRDTDMAKEMMAYTKNNILVQASTAMLAQANQIPQSVLQLLH